MTAGGRVLGVTAVADTLEEAVRDAYSYVNAISFENAFWRQDIGKRALAAAGAVTRRPDQEAAEKKNAQP